MSQTKTFTGRTKRRETKLSVKLSDGTARVLITIGGFGTILAVSTVCIFLVYVVVPMFKAPAAELVGSVQQQWKELGTPSTEIDVPVHIMVDDYNLMMLAAFPDGRIRTIALDSGELLEERSVVEGAALTSWSFPQRGTQVALGYADGSFRMAQVGFDLRFAAPESLGEEFIRLQPLEVKRYENGLAQMTHERQLRILTLHLELGDPIQTGSDSPIVLLDQAGAADRPIVVTLSEDESMRISQIRGRRNLMTGRITYTTTGGEIPYEPRPQRPSHLKLSGLGDNVYLVWRDGILHRYDTRDYQAMAKIEEVDLIEDPAVELTSIGFLIGRTTILVGDSAGNVSSWFRTRVEGAETADSIRLTRVVGLPGEGAGPVTSISSSQRKRIIAVGHADGRVRLHNVTNGRFLMEPRTDSRNPVGRVVLNPRDNGLVALTRDRVWHWDTHIPHPEVSWDAIFGRVWYEGYSEPAFVWQSTGGTDDFESKYSLVPLIFGTIKATLYSMLFGVPLALLAAIFTSEFLHPRVKAAVKPGVEMMASLPSVVLGFLAGLVVAPYLEDKVPTALCVLATVPFTFLLASYCWNLLPRNFRLRYDQLRFVFVLLTLPLGISLATAVAPLFENAFFYVGHVSPETGEIIKGERDIKLWLNVAGDPRFVSSGIGGWFLLFLPLSAFVMAYVMSRFVNPKLMERSRGWSWNRLASLDLVKFAIGLAITVVVALALSSFVSAFGLDARGSYIGPYVQRNALIVGFIMGFAVIPIIYTIADDAMSAVPEHLRSASLGAGATRWQTAMRIIIPTAMSGLFSAVMIGFGRAVGETMIVLMAAGNTPVLDWNIFNGFRTLSANIAVELPEAVRDSTNYRMLFLAALTLFIMTFLINTVAEMVRLRYRKTAYQL